MRRRKLLSEETWNEAAKAIRDAGGKAWDDVADPEAYLARELTSLARESVERDKTLAKLEAEVIASREIVVKAVARAEELEGLVREYRKAWSDEAVTQARWRLFAAVSNGESK